MPKELNLKIYGEIETDVSDVKRQINNLKDSLDKLSIPKKNFDGFQKTLFSLERKIQDFESLAMGGIHSLEDTTKINRSWNDISNTLNKVTLSLRNFNFVSDSILPKDFTKQVNKVNEALTKYSAKVKEVKNSTEYGNKKRAVTQANQISNRQNDSLLKAKNRRDAAQTKLGEVEKEWSAEKQADYKKEIAARDQLIKKISEQGALIAEQENKLKKFRESKVITEKNQVNASTAASFKKKQEDIDNKAKALKEANAALEAAKKELPTAQQKAGLSRSKSAYEKLSKEEKKKDKNKDKKTQIDEKEKSFTEKQKAYDNAVKLQTKAQKELNEAMQEDSGIKAYNEDVTKSLQLVKELAEAQAKLKDLQNQKATSDTTIKEDYDPAKGKYNKATAEVAAAEQQVKEISVACEEAQKDVERLSKEFKEFELGSTQNEWQELLRLMNELRDEDTPELFIDQGDITSVEAFIRTLTQDKLKQVPEVLDKIRQEFEDTSAPAKKVASDIHKVADTAQELTDAQREVENLKDQMVSFFSIGNALEMFKRALRSAFETVKELDKAMTDTAVVTDFSVGDMWEQLPKYTDSANKLGTTTLGAYETMTLFYQQGLKTNEAFAVGEETMKMARIANLDYANATNLMTAALRGFNMELNETSATRVNDVYSKLAAITAADTQEIAKAMTKTASIAHSANMEFETTAAFLSQIIETTRESAETAGTAMKTVIARFQELKKNPEEITEVDGEVVDANQIEGALRTVGVALRDVDGQFRNLDDVFLELASKWSGLDRNTQRYIATIAAGSRQQSRFLAMMSDYNRTMELVDAANNSAGASQKQFEKTIDSLGNKLNQLKNAWDQFAMGLANDKLIKSGVESLTFLLKIINGLTDALPGLGSSFAKIALSIGALKVGRSVFSAFKDNSTAEAEARARGEEYSGSFAEAFKKNLAERTSGLTKFIHSLKRRKFDRTARSGGEQNLQYVDKKGNFDNKNLLAITKKIAIEEAKRKGIQADIEKKEKSIAEYKERQKELQVSLNEADRKRKHHKKFNKENYNANQAENNSLDVQIADTSSSLVQDENALQESTDRMEDLIRRREELEERRRQINQANTDYDNHAAEEAMEQLESNINRATVAAGALGMVLSFVSSQLREMGDDRSAEAFEALSNGAIVAAGALSVIPKIIFAITNSLRAMKAASVLIAVISGVIAIISAISAWYEDAEEKMSRLEEEMTQAKKTAEDTKAAFDKIADSKNKYDDMQESLSKITRGTLEWKKALFEANQQVLDLISNYPELAKDVIRSSDGVLTIKQEGWEEFQKQSYERVVNAQSTSTIAAIAVSEEKKRQAQGEKDELWEANLGGGMAYYKQINKVLENPQAYRKYSTDDFLNLDEDQQRAIWNNSNFNQYYGDYDTAKEQDPDRIQEIVSGYDGIYKFNEELITLAKKIGVTGEMLVEVTEASADIDDEIRHYDIEMKGQLPNLMANAMSQESNSSKYSNQVIGGLSDRNETDFEEKTEAEVDEIEDKHYSEEQLKEVYKKTFGIDPAEDLSEDDMTRQIAQSRVGKKEAKKAEDVIKKLETLEGKGSEGAEAAKLLAGLIGGDSKQFSKNDTKTLQTLLGENYWEKMGYASKEEMAAQTGFNSITEMDIVFTEIKDGIESAFADVETKRRDNADGLNIYDEDFYKNSTAEQQESLVNVLTLALGTSGKEGAQSFADNFSEVMTYATEDQKKLILDSLKDFDFSKANAPEEFINLLNSLGVHLPIKLTEDFTKDLNKLNESFKRIDLTKLKEEIASIQKLSDDLEKRENKEGVSQEEYDALTGQGIASKEDFMWNGQEYIYLEGPLSDLSEAIKANTEALLSRNKELLEDSVERGTKVEELLNNNLVNDEITKDGQSIDQEDFLNGKATLDQIRALFDLDETTTNAEALTYYKQALSDFNNLGQNRATLANYDQETYGIGMDTGFDVLNQRHPQSSEEIKQSPEEIKQQDNALKALLLTEKGAAGKVRELKDAFEKQDEEVKGNEKVITALGIDITQAEKKVKSLCEEVEKNSDAFKTGNEALKAGKTASVDYYSALEEITTAAQGVFGESVTEDFVKNHSELFEQLSEGGEVGKTAFEKIQAEISALALQNLPVAESELQNLNLLIDQANRDFEVNGYADVTDIVNKLLEAGMTAEEVKARVEELTGMSVDFEVSYQTIDIPWEQASDYAKRGFKVDSSGMSAKVVVPKAVRAGGAKATKKTYEGSGYSPKKSGGGGKEEQVWENPYDELYNSVQKLNKALREREQLERRYQRLLQGRGTQGSAPNAKELKANDDKELAKLNSAKSQSEAQLAARQTQAEKLIASKPEMSKYASFEDGRVYINWDEINKITDPEKGEEVEKFIEELEERQEQIEGLQDSLLDIDDQIYEINQKGKEEFLQLEEQVKKAVVDSYQKEIDEMSSINDSINDANDRLLNAMQQSIEQTRQDRQNEKTEEEMQDKETRLAYLQQDTSGANDLEILSLQDELEQDHQDYTDTLIDQKIQELQMQNDAAAVQRERQITLAQAMLDQYVSSGEIWTQVKELMDSGLDPEKGLVTGSKLEELLKASENFKAMSEAQKTEWADELNTQIAQALTYLQKQEGADSDSSSSGSSGEDSGEGSGTETESSEQKQITVGGMIDATGASIYSNSKGGGKSSQYFGSDPYYTVLGENNGYLKVRHHKAKSGVTGWFKKDDVKAYKTGGLADFTGPAWLDGSASKPEIVLNAQDSKNFMQLKDILASLLNPTGASNSTTENNGDNHYDIDINVESISQDYDVEKVAKKVKSMIVNDAMYRNVNAVDNKR